MKTTLMAIALLAGMVMGATRCEELAAGVVGSRKVMLATELSCKAYLDPIYLGISNATYDTAMVFMQNHLALPCDSTNIDEMSKMSMSLAINVREQFNYIIAIAKCPGNVVMNALNSVKD